MKRLIAALVLSIGLLAPFMPAFGQVAWNVEEFHSDVTVRKDGSLDVHERIKAIFLTERHGIFRYVPYQGTNDQGELY